MSGLDGYWAGVFWESCEIYLCPLFSFSVSSFFYILVAVEMHNSLYVLAAWSE
jgi:hypothetical protein